MRKSKILVEPLDLSPLVDIVGQQVRNHPRVESIVGIIPGGRLGVVKIAKEFYVINSLGATSFLPANNLLTPINFYPIFSDDSIAFSPVQCIHLTLEELLNYRTHTYENLANFILNYGYLGEGKFTELNVFFSDLKRAVKKNVSNEQKLVDNKQELDIYKTYLINSACKCINGTVLVGVNLNTCTCGNDEVHLHCRNCGGILEQQGKRV